jgi:predicted acyl esterase
METSKENEQFTFDTYDTFDWYLALGSLANVNRSVLKGKIPTWNDFVAHPNYDAFWQRQAMAPYLTRVTVPTLNVAGWWDQEDFYGPVRIYETLEQRDSSHLNFLVVGPWNHGGWGAPEGRQLGNIDFGGPTTQYFRANIQAPFFAFYLQGKGTLQKPEATVFDHGAGAEHLVPAHRS